ncbi:MAG: hypothetical protein VZS44_09150 [Bacilli bacterium]|nr:hypothetical protein [Bacilli bacterium]
MADLMQIDELLQELAKLRQENQEQQKQINKINRIIDSINVMVINLKSDLDDEFEMPIKPIPQIPTEPKAPLEKQLTYSQYVKKNNEDTEIISTPKTVVKQQPKTEKPKKEGKFKQIMKILFS